LFEAGALCLELRQFSQEYFGLFDRNVSKPAIANHPGHRLLSALAGRLFLAVFGERQLVAKNLDAAEKLFQPDDQQYTLAIKGSCAMSSMT
jgi:hypothetical protein